MPDVNAREHDKVDLLRLLKEAGVEDARLPEGKPVIVPEHIGLHLRAEQVQKALIVSMVPSIEWRNHTDKMGNFSTLTVRSEAGEVTLFVNSAEVAAALFAAVEGIMAHWPKPKDDGLTPEEQDYEAARANHE